MRTPRHLKHRIILATLYTTGLRASELSRLQGTDIDSGCMVVVVHQGKGKKDRQVPLSPELLPQLRHYWKLYGLQSWLFPGRRVSDPLTRHGVHHICAQAGKDAKLKKAVYPHLLRHYLASRVMPSTVLSPHRISHLFSLTTSNNT